MSEGPNEALLRSWWQQMDPTCRELHDAGWPITKEVVRTDDGRLVAVIAVEIGLKNLPPNASVLPLVVEPVPPFATPEPTKGEG